MAMIAGCPSCATRHGALARRDETGAWPSRCSACGHSWREANATEIIEARIENAVAIVEDHELDQEARRLARAASLAAERHLERQRTRRAQLRGWALLALAVAVPLTGAMAYPEAVTRAAPAAAQLYSLAGIEVNVSGFMIRDAASEIQIVSGTALLAVRGEIVNVSDRPQEAPSLQFVLREDSGVEAFGWSLNRTGARKLAPGEATSFITRVAAPPAGVQEVEIRFARGE